MSAHPQPQTLPTITNLAQVTTLTLESEEPLVQMKQQVSVDELEWWQECKPTPPTKEKWPDTCSCLVATYQNQEHVMSAINLIQPHPIVGTNLVKTLTHHVRG